MDRRSVSFFEGLSPEAQSQIQNRLERRNFAAGARIIEEGEERRGIFIVLSGHASVLVRDREGLEHVINTAGPGDTLGEVSFFSGQPASASVHAITELDLLTLGVDEFTELADTFPRLYHNIGAILAGRLARVSRHATRAARGRTSVLIDEGAPPLLGYALACSVAWHTRRRVLLLVVTETPATELSDLATRFPQRNSSFAQAVAAHCATGKGAQLLVVAPRNSFAPETLATTVDDLCSRFDHVLVQLPANKTSGKIAGNRFCLRGGDPKANSSAAHDGRGHYVCPRDAREHKHKTDRECIVYAPEFSPTDFDALGQGILPAVSSAGRALGWAARDIGGLRVGLALGAGGPRGYAHIGVLKVLASLGLVANCVAGTSIGAAVASLHAAGRSPEQVRETVDAVGRSAFRLTLPIRSLLSIAGVRAGVHRAFGELRFEDLQIPLAVVAADLATGEPVVLKSGLVWPCVVASMAIPGVYPPQETSDRILIDGGVANPLPSDVAAELGADIILAVKLRNPFTSRPQTLLQTFVRTLDVMQANVATKAATTETVLIEPAFQKEKDYSLRSFTEGQSYISLGEAAARAALPRIKSALPWLV
jgi:NTE family protein